MGILIDVNTVPSVFSKKSIDHRDYEPVLRWIIKGKGKMIMGGATYLAELRKLPSYLMFLGEMRKLRKIYNSVDAEVDKVEAKVVSMEPNRDFDDAHLIAIIICSECKLFCSKDSRSFKFIRNPKFYPKPISRPYIYTNHRHPPKIHILCDHNLSPKCEPHTILPSIIADKLYEMLT